jgi:hypothetical protein
MDSAVGGDRVNSPWTAAATFDMGLSNSVRLSTGCPHSTGDTLVAHESGSTWVDNINSLNYGAIALERFG